MLGDLESEGGSNPSAVRGGVARTVSRRGEADERSDSDLLVRMEPGRSLFDVGALIADLEELLGRSVDVVTEAGLRPRLRVHVLRDARLGTRRSTT
jgi:predicted nucleotidyltransferase